MSERETRVQKVAAILRDAIFRRGQSWERAAEEVLDAMESEDAWEYNIESLDLVTGHTRFWRDLWEPEPSWLQRKLDERKAYDRKLLNTPNGGPLEYEHKLVKRRKAGKAEDV